LKPWAPISVNLLIICWKLPKLVDESLKTKSLLAAFCFLLFHYLVSAIGGAGVWGVDSLLYGTVTSKLFWVGFGVLVLYAAIPFTFFPSTERLSVRAIILLSIVPVLLLLISLSSATHLLGDGYLYIRELDNGTRDSLSRKDRAPLTFWILLHLHKALQHLGVGGEALYRSVSLLSGIAYFLLSLKVGSVLTEQRDRRRIISACLLTAGYLQLFFGYVEKLCAVVSGHARSYRVPGSDNP